MCFFCWCLVLLKSPSSDDKTLFATALFYWSDQHTNLYAMMKPSIAWSIWVCLSLCTTDLSNRPLIADSLCSVHENKSSTEIDDGILWTSANVLECSRAPACECDTSIRWGLAILINCFSAPREDLSWFTLILSFGGSIVAGTVFGNSLSSRIPAINFPFHRFCHCYRNHCHTLNVWSYFGIINMHAHSEQWYSSYTKKRRIFFCRGGYMTPSQFKDL